MIRGNQEYSAGVHESKYWLPVVKSLSLPLLIERTAIEAPGLTLTLGFPQPLLTTYILHSHQSRRRRKHNAHPFVKRITQDSQPMPGRGGRQNGRVDEDSRPLLVSSREDLSSTLTSPSTENVLFSVDGDEGEHETSALEDTHKRNKADQTVRFEEHVQVIAPSLRSTTESREAGMYGTVIVIVFFFRGCTSVSVRRRWPATERMCPQSL